MAKPYSLDYEIRLASDRTAAIHDILNELETQPPDADLEQMADYILFGKDAANLSVVDTKEITQPKRRYNSYRTKAEQDESLEALTEDPMVAQDIENTAKPVGPDCKSPYKVLRQEIRRTKYADDGVTILEYGDDFDNYHVPIPFMRELWESIDRWQERIDMYKGKIPPNDWVRHHPKTKYQVYKLGHFLIELRRHQYYIKDSYNPTLHFFNIKPPSHSAINWHSDTGLWLSSEEWCARKRHPLPHDLPQPPIQDAIVNDQGQYFWEISQNTFDYENPRHILGLLDNYVVLLKRCYAHPDSDMRQMLWDLEDIIEKANLTDLEQFVLEQRVAHRNTFLIQKILVNEGIELSDSRLHNMMRNIIPKKLANAAKRHRLLSDMENGRIPYLVCSKCGSKLPKDPLFFARAKDKKTGFCSRCKECQKAERERPARGPIEVKL